MSTYVQTPTPKLEESMAFYQQLNFSSVTIDGIPMVTDGQVLIHINPDTKARAGIKLLKPSWKSEIEKLQAYTKVNTTEEGYLFSLPSGTWMYLLEGDDAFTMPERKAAVPGTYGGMSLETTDIDRSIALLEILGFSKSMGDPSQGWVAYKNQDEFTVSLMLPNICPHLFFNPSLTYFNGLENLAVIEQVRQNNIPITQEITWFGKDDTVDNIIIRDPGGLGFFLFND